MRILVLSDSHSSLSFMRQCIAAVRPDWVLHLGDFYEDGAVMAEEYPQIPFCQVPGNCDAYRCPPNLDEVRSFTIEGVRFFMTHGHRHQVKSTLDRFLRNARLSKAHIALYGHTHIPDCHREEDGLWVLNPGSCGYFGGTAGLVLVEDGAVRTCRILRQEDLEAIG